MVRCCQGQFWSNIAGMADHAFHQFKLRLPSELFQQLETAAAEANRSVSAEIVTRLEASFEQRPANGQATEVDMLYTILQSTNGLLHVSAHYLKELLERMPADEGDELFLAHIRNFAEHLHADNLPAAAEKLQEMIALGLKIGAIDPDTGKPKKPREK